METQAIAQLTQVDERVQRFTPLGLSTGGHILTPEAAARFQQEAISRSDLMPAVPEDTRRSFERLRQLHTYGVFCYELYTAADDQSLLVFDQALRERFVQCYAGNVTVVDKHGKEVGLLVKSFDEVYEALRRGGGHGQRWKLKLRNGEVVAFRPTFPGLLEWARSEGLLRGQRTRRLDEVYVRMRNRVAHPSSYGLITPVDSARSIRDLAEIINHLWGSPTAGGRLYPAPVAREICALCWDERTGTRALPRADQLGSMSEDERGWTYIILRAVPQDDGLWEFDSRFETTTFPAESCWGPGTWDEALAWLRTERPQGDEVDPLDRLFLIRVHGDEVELPRRPEVAAGLTGAARVGTWHVIRADHPFDAYAHVRGPGGVRNPNCSLSGLCAACPVETISVGTFEEVINAVGPVEPLVPPEVWVPRRT